MWNRLEHLESHGYVTVELVAAVLALEFEIALPVSDNIADADREAGFLHWCEGKTGTAAETPAVCYHDKLAEKAVAAIESPAACCYDKLGEKTDTAPGTQVGGWLHVSLPKYEVDRIAELKVESLMV